MKLPIHRVAGTVPPQFEYSQIIDTINGKQVIKHVGAVASSMETALCNLLVITEQLIAQNAELRKMVRK